MQPANTNASTVRNRHRLKTLIVASVAATAILIPTVHRADAADVCTGAECDTVAFINDQSLVSIYQDLLPDSPVGSFYFGEANDEPIMGDWDCDGEQTPGLYRRTTGSVYLRNSNTQGIADMSFVFGNPGDIPLAGDFDGNGCDTLAIYRPSQARFYVSNTLGSETAETSFAFGEYGDVPIVGDFDGDGVDTVGIYRDESAFVALSNTLGSSQVDHAFYFGNPGDQLVAGDWDGDNVDTVAVYRPSTGVFYLQNRHQTGVATYSMTVGRYEKALSASGVDNLPDPQAPDTRAATQAPVTRVATGDAVAVAGFAAPPPRPASGPVRISGESNVVIENLHISNPSGRCVVVTNASNVTIRNSTIGPCGDEAVYLSGADGAVVSGNYIAGTGNGVLVHRSDSVRVDSNAFVDAGRNFVQFDNVDGAGSSISGNRGQNELGGTNAEDFISLWQSNGTPSSPIMVAGNSLRGGGPSKSGSGIMLGDGGGSYQVAHDNHLVDPGQVGIGIASGTNITVTENLIYSKSVPWSNVGVYVWNQYGKACGDVVLSGNQVDWASASGRSSGFWSGGGCASISLSNNNWSANLTSAIWD